LTLKKFFNYLWQFVDFDRLNAIRIRIFKSFDLALLLVEAKNNPLPTSPFAGGGA